MQEKVFNDTKKEIRSVLLTYQKGVSLDEFLKEYRNLVGQRLPSRTLGFSSDIDFFKSMPDVVHVSTNNIGKILLTGIADEKSEHIKKLVSKQRAARPNNRSNRNGSRQRSKVPNRLPRARESTIFVPGPVRAQMLQLMTAYPDGITFSSFVLAYLKNFNKYLDLKRGLETLECMIKTISEMEIKMVGNEKKIFLKGSQDKFVLNKTGEVQNNHTSLQQTGGDRNQLSKQTNDSSNIDKSGIPEAVQKNFQLILDKCPEGILAIHFPPLYEKVAGKSFELHELGYNSILEMVDALPLMFKRILDPSNDRDWVILPANSSIQGKKKSKSEAEDSSASIRKKISPLKFRETVPADAASPLLQYLPPNLPKDIDLNGYLPVYVSAIVSPGLFWFQLQTDEAIEELEELEHSLDSFYSGYYNEKYKMHDGDIVIGATCVVLCPDDLQWYRAVIKSIPSIDDVNVLFVDYGSRENVPKKMIRYVRSIYLDYPAHAFKAQLTGLKPPKNVSVWDIRSQQRFIELCECCSLKAHLKPIDKDTFSVDLWNISGDNDIHIGDTLVKEGYAECIVENSFGSNRSSNVSSTILNGGPSDADSFVTVTSSPAIVTQHSLNGDSIGYKDIISSQSEKEVFTSDSDDMLVKRKLSFSTERQSSDTEKEVTNALNESCPKRYIKLLKLCEDSKIYIINYKDKPYTSAGDISKLLWKDKDAICLEERLKYKEVDVPGVDVSKEDNAELFRQCACYKLPDLESNGSSLTLYPLEWSFNILNIFGHPSICLRLAIQNEIRRFDPHDSVWNEFSYADSQDLKSIEKEIEENFGSLCLYDLKPKYEALKIKRLKLLKVNNTSATEEIKRIEHLQFIISKRMEHITSICSQYSSYL